MAEKNQSINNVFKLLKKGYLGSGTFGFTYKGLSIRSFILFFIIYRHSFSFKIIGILNPPNVEVAMKFTSSEYEAEATREFEIYSYLNAVKNSSVEAFGIPSVYYCGRWNGYILMAITSLDSEIKKKSDEGKVNNVDVMIIFREFVSIEKN